MNALTQQQQQAIDDAVAQSGGGGYLPAAVVNALVASGIPIEQLLLGLVPVAQRYAIPPISNFFVGAAALGTSGSIYLGANFEFTGEALSFCIHGEQAATAHAISYEETGLQMLAVSAAPCGYCRQFLYELTTASTLQILLPNKPTALLSALLPDAFGPGDLGVSAALMSPQAHGLEISSRGDALATAALKAANSSYAPYSFSYAGVALATRDGRIHSGSYAENAAYNPSMSPLEAAIVSLTIDGREKYADITDAVLVQVAGAKASQVDVTRAVLSAIANVPLRVYEATAPSASS